MTNSNDKRLFLACFIALIATAFGFIVRTQVMGDWGQVFNLSSTQKGEIFGVGLWPFAISIVLFSLIIDRIGYGRAVVFALFCHVTSVVITLCAPLVLAGEGASQEEIAAGQAAGYWMLYAGNFIVALGNGTVEAFINPIVATMFAKEKTKWLNILHAGWPGGLVVGGILAISLGGVTLDMGSVVLANWQLRVALILIPVVLYGLLMIGCKFPPNERVAAGVSYRDMLKEPGILGCALVVALIVLELGRVAAGLIGWNPDKNPTPDWYPYVQLTIGVLLVLVYGAYVRSLGRFMFFFLMIIMIPLAITELGTDSWITGLMENQVPEGINAGWVLVYTSFIMLVLRFFAGPIVHKISPLGLLLISSAIAALGLLSLSLSVGTLIILAATLYGVGKTFFWPTMLGVVSEQFPKGGALTLNMIAGLGMLGAGVIGGSFLGYLQDTRLGVQLKEKEPIIYQTVMADKNKTSVFGKYLPLKDNADESLGQKETRQMAVGTIGALGSPMGTGPLLAAGGAFPERESVETKVFNEYRNDVRKNVLMTVALLPTFMFVCYLLLIFYFRAKGGYKAEVLTGHGAEDEKFTGGVEGGMEA